MNCLTLEPWIAVNVFVYVLNTIHVHASIGLYSFLFSEMMEKTTIQISYHSNHFSQSTYALYWKWYFIRAFYKAPLSRNLTVIPGIAAALQLIIFLNCWKYFCENCLILMKIIRFFRKIFHSVSLQVNKLTYPFKSHSILWALSSSSIFLWEFTLSDFEEKRRQTTFTEDWGMNPREAEIRIRWECCVLGLQWKAG